jgi:hypothetical protein
VGDQGGAYWNGYFYIWYSNADKSSVGVARSQTGLPGTWLKYYQGSFSSAGTHERGEREEEREGREEERERA